MSNKKYTDEQKQLVISLAKIEKNSCEISGITGIPKQSVKNIMCAAKRAGRLDYIRKCPKRNYHNDPLVPPPPPETLRDKEAKFYKGKYDDENIPVIKLKPMPYKSIFDVRG